MVDVQSAQNVVKDVAKEKKMTIMLTETQQKDLLALVSNLQVQVNLQTANATLQNLNNLFAAIQNPIKIIED